MKSSLLSIIKSSFSFIIDFDGLKFIFFCKILGLNLKLKMSILSFVFILNEPLTFFLFILIFPFLYCFSINPWGISPKFFLIQRSIRILLYVEVTLIDFFMFCYFITKNYAVAIFFSSLGSFDVSFFFMSTFLASTSLSTNSISAIGALSPYLKPAFIILV